MKITIITVVKNNKSGLTRAIRSVQSQTYKNTEHIIVDGGSTDGTAEYLRQPLDRFRVADQNKKPLDTSANSALPQPRGADQDGNKLLTNHYSLITVSESDSGIYDAINKGIKLATGDIIGLLHSDDFYKDEFVLEKIAGAFGQRVKGKAQRYFDRLSVTDQGEKVDAVYSDLVYVSQKSKVKGQKPETGSTENKVLSTNEDSTSIGNSSLNIEYSIVRTWKTHSSAGSEQPFDTSTDPALAKPIVTDQSEKMISNHYSPLTTYQLLNGWMPPHPTLFLRKEIFDKYGLYRTDMKIAADYEMILRLFYRHKISARYLPQTTYCMTMGGISNKSLKNIIIKSREDYRAMVLHSIPLPFITLVLKNIRKVPQFFKQ